MSLPDTQAPTAAPRVAHHFADLEQQHSATTLGLWLFLASEILFFGGLFTAYAVMRFQLPEGFALASSRLSAPLGAFNTAVLLTSSFTMALAVWSAQTARRTSLLLCLAATLLLGTTFVGIKMYEWHHEYENHLVPPGALFPGHSFEPVTQSGERVEGDVARGMQMFFVFYFTITALHALHMVIGLAVLIVLLILVWRGPFGIKDHPIELAGLYWHFVDIVWIFVFPIIYLLRH